MGLLQDGKWVDQWYNTEKSEGRFLRTVAGFRNWVTPDGAPGLSGDGGFKAESGRYHLYVSLACPWAHRTLIFRKLKGLEEMISLSVVNWFMGKDGWTFDEGAGVIADSQNKAQFMHQVYTAAVSNFSGRVTVPVLWDKVTGTIVSNESSEIIRMFNSAFDGIGAAAGDYYPAPLRGDIDALNARIYNTVNNGVYRSGFATNEEAYLEAVTPLFETLDWLEGILDTNRYLTGANITEADWRLFTTLVRFDAVYFGHFKCNLKRIVDYPNLWRYLRDLYNQPGIAATVDMDHIKKHYYASHDMINPTRIVPVGPEIDFSL
ncbi:glutathione S-transferase family protein [Alphaproteobacteria bacterium]|jgi:putative glutathione S-transferase|nr:glutathione S-transferase family protein [Alphaproteobacteria bacterium]